MSALQVVGVMLVATVMLVVSRMWVQAIVCWQRDRRAADQRAQAVRAWLKSGPTESYERERAARLRAAKTQRKTS